MPCFLPSVHLGPTCIHLSNTNVYNDRLHSNKKSYRYILHMDGSHREMLKKTVMKRTYHMNPFICIQKQAK